MHRSRMSVLLGAVLLPLMLIGLFWDQTHGRSGLAWKPMAVPCGQNLIRHELTLEAGHHGWGDGTIITRTNAWGGDVVHMNDGDGRFESFAVLGDMNLSATVRYSNAGTGPGETITLYVDGIEANSFVAESTGTGDEGWNTFTFSPSQTLTATIAPGPYHTLGYDVGGGDGEGVEVDAFILNYDAQAQCAFLPVMKK